MKKETNPRKATAEFSGADEVLREVWRNRDAISATYGNDVGRLCAAMREKQKYSGHPVVDLSKGYRVEQPALACVRETPEKDKT